MADDPLVLPAEAARQLNLNRSTLSRQIANRQVRSHNGKVRVSEVREDRARNLRSAEPAIVEDTTSAPSFARARAVKETYLAQLRRLEFQVKSGALISADKVRTAVFDLARQDRDALSNWPAQSAPTMAAELGVDSVKLAVVLEKYVRQHLAERSDPELRIRE